VSAGGGWCSIGIAGGRGVIDGRSRPLLYRCMPSPRSGRNQQKKPSEWDRFLQKLNTGRWGARAALPARALFVESSSVIVYNQVKAVKVKVRMWSKLVKHAKKRTDETAPSDRAPTARVMKSTLLVVKKEAVERGRIVLERGNNRMGAVRGLSCIMNERPLPDEPVLHRCQV
jgi:hypothetical protein